MMIILCKQKKYAAELEVNQRAIARMEKAIAANQQAITNRNPVMDSQLYAKPTAKRVMARVTHILTISP